MIKQIIFDWGGVCCTGAEPFAALQKLGFDPDEIVGKLHDVHNHYYRGLIPREVFWQHVLAKVTTPSITADEMSAAYIASYQLHDRVMELIPNLRKQFQVTLLSNLTPEMRDHIIQTHDLKKIFDDLVFSCDQGVGVLKPDPTIYKYILRKYNRQANEVLFIDDSLKNIQAAADLGIQVMHFTGEQAFLGSLQKLGVVEWMSLL